jgi:hypothetical protein
MAKTELIEKASDPVGGGATGVTKSADPHATGDAYANRNNTDKKEGDTASAKLAGEVQGTDATNNTNNTKGNADTTASIKTKPSAAGSMKEEIDGLFGEDLSEEFKEKASVIFEAAIASRIAEERAALEEELNASFAKARTDLVEELSNQVSDYLDYVVEQWMDTNQVAIDSSLNTMIAEEFIEKLKGLFEDSYIQVPKEKVDLVAEMAAKVEELESKLNDTVAENIELSKIVESSKQSQIFDDVAEGLAMTQVEKLRTLSEGIDFDTDENYRKKLELVKEQYFGEKKTVVAKSIEEQEIVELDEEVTHQPKLEGPVSSYVSAIARSIKK